MFRALAQSLKPSKSIQGDYARDFERRDVDMCVMTINDTLHPVQNWSMGGAFVTAESHDYDLNQTLPCILQFKTPNAIKRITLSGTVVRKTSTGIALAFKTPSDQAQAVFLEVIQNNPA